MTPQRVVVRAGYLIINKTTASGGIKRDRIVIDDREVGKGGRETVSQTDQKVDHVLAVKQVTAIAKHIEWLCRKHCSWTLLGWIASESELEKLKVDLERAREDADAANVYAASVGSRHRVEVCVVPAEIDLATPDAAIQIARTIRKLLGEMRDALASGDPDAVHAPLVKSGNLHRLASGMAGEAIVLAIDCVKAVRSELKARLKEISALTGATRDRAVEQIVAELTPTLEPIDSAIAYFSEGVIGEELISSEVA